MQSNILRLSISRNPLSLFKRHCFKSIPRPDMTKLKISIPSNAVPVIDILWEKIKLSGPISVADYMNIVVANPAGGYYMKSEAIGRQGDFVTSPEICQLFGEILGIWFINETSKMCSPSPLQIVELGPGNGTLLVDLLRTVSRLGYKSRDISLHLVEVSPTLQQAQANRLCITHHSSDPQKDYYYEGETLGGSQVRWYRDLRHVPPGFSWYLAHEFFDALPIHKFQRTEKGWQEVLVDMDLETKKLSFKISEPTQKSKIFLRPPLTDRKTDSLEISPETLKIANKLSERVEQDGGIALIADYGHDGSKGDTFRAFKRHELVDPLCDPGGADVTADVDFQQLLLAASHCFALGPTSQENFLNSAGAELRLQVLLENTADEEHKKILKSGYDMLTNANKMGQRFQFTALFPTTMKEMLGKYPPSGFQSR